MYSSKGRRRQQEQYPSVGVHNDDYDDDKSSTRPDKLRIVKQRIRDEETSRPSAAAADENFEYIHQRSSIRERVNEYDEWLLSHIPYDIRNWGKWR